MGENLMGKPQSTMKLVFYSGGQNRSNRKIHKALGELARGTRKGKNLSLTYIPVWSEGSEIFFKRLVRRYAAVGFSEFKLLPADVPVSEKLVKNAFRSDVIYLAGGNTFYFLAHLRKRGLLPC